MRPTLYALTLVLVSAAALAEQPDAAAIMARVAANQDSSQAGRDHYIYVQHARVASRKGKKVMCEEITDSRVTPTSTGSSQELLRLDGRLWQKHTYVSYTTLPPPKETGNTHVKAEHESSEIHIETDDTMDRDLVESMRGNLTKTDSRDGIGDGLFPLTSKNQKGYQFHLLGQERRNGRDTFHIAFSPRDKDDLTWKGDAYIDTVDYQPVLIHTALARNIPFAIRTLLGTSLPGIGFTIIYAPQPDGVWFPISFGTEFKMRILFFLAREITLSAENREFVKTHVTSRIVPGEAATPDPPR